MKKKNKLLIQIYNNNNFLKININNHKQQNLLINCINNNICNLMMKIKFIN